jgi:hypothetical protein
MRKGMAHLLVVAVLSLTFASFLASAAFAVKPSPNGTKSNGRQTYPPQETPPSCSKKHPPVGSCPSQLNTTFPGNQSAIPLGIVLGLGLAVVVTTPMLVSRRRARAHH